MVTSLAAQLAQIAAKSRVTLDTRASRAAHSKSLIFEPRVASAQSFPEIYALCREGYDELCRLDARFAPFGTTLFSDQSQDIDRIQLTADENKGLDARVENFLRLAGGRLRLMPAIKAIEWLIRRFRIHEFNTAILVATFLPYHTIPAFVTLLSILPPRLPHEYIFLDPYVRSLTAPPRAAIVRQAIHRPEMLSTISQYALQSCRSRAEYPALVSFWGGVMVEAVNGMLDKKRSGRKGVQMDGDATLLQQVMPTLSEAMVMKRVPEMQIASYMIVIILAAKGSLGDAALSAFMDQLVCGWTSPTYRTGLLCLCILAQHRSAKQLPARVAKALLKVPDLAVTLQEIGREHRVDKLAGGAALALVDRTCKKGDVRGLAVVKSLLLGRLLHEKQIKVVYKSMLLAAHRIEVETDPESNVRSELGSMLVILSQASEEAGDAIREAIDETELDIEEIELRLGAPIRPRPALTPAPHDADMATGAAEPARQKEAIEASLERISSLELDQSASSCLLSDDPTAIFDSLCSLFLSVATEDSDLFKFDQAALVHRESAATQPFYLTLYMRVWSGPYPALARARAVERAKNRLKEKDFSGLDLQAIIPYCVSALSDPAKRVRRAAADLVTVLASQLADSHSREAQVWGIEGLYGESKIVHCLHWMDLDAAGALLQSVLVPALEESVLDENHISAALVAALENSKSSKDSTEQPKKPRLSHAIRQSTMRFLAGHAIATPLIKVKLRLLKPLNQIRSISNISRTDLLLPLLQWWLALSGTKTQEIATRELVDVGAVDEACVDVVAANSEEGLKALLSAVKTTPSAVSRPTLLQAMFARIRKIWPQTRGKLQRSAALELLELAQTNGEPGTDDGVVSAEAADLLRHVHLTPDILLDFLDSLQVGVKLATEPLANRRRRLSASDHSRVGPVQASPKLMATLARVTFVLELVQGSKPAEYPELLPSLFTTLSDMQHLRAAAGSELGYLQNLVLSSLLEMMPTYKNNKSLAIDASVGYGDILATCIQRSTSPAVINAALLLVASLAKTAPDVVLHSVMPIFTFMGSSVLRQTDQYSAHVVNQTVKEVIPPLMDTFRKSRKTLVASTAELISSFVIAYEHIPPHRRHDLFVSLIQNIGPGDHLFAVFAIFVDKYGPTDNILSFLGQIAMSFSVEVQFQTLTKLLALVGDMLKSRPVLSVALFGKKNENGDQEAQKAALKQLTLVPHLLANRTLKKETAQFLAGRDDMESAKIRYLHANLLEDLLTVAGVVKTKKQLYSRCGDALSNLLNLLSTAEFIKSVETLLCRPSIALRQKVLRALELRVDGESSGSEDPTSRVALLAFLPQLTAVIRESDDMAYKQTAITCVDKIAEKYGKKDLEAVAAAAATIAGDSCLGQPSRQLRVMALLCLASLVDVLQDGIVPVLPMAVPKALNYLEQSLGRLQGEQKKQQPVDAELHNAAYAFFTSLAQHVSYMISGATLDRLLALSNISAAAVASGHLNAEAGDNRMGCLRFLAKLLDAKVLFEALQRNWAQAIENGGLAAIKEHLHILGLAIEKYPKAAIAKNMAPLSAIFLDMLDLRRVTVSSTTTNGQEASAGTARYGEMVAHLDEVERAAHEVGLRMIYKLNDATFRPLFTRVMEWSASGSGLAKGDSAGRMLRQLGVYGFLESFFGNLKSIVTSYAAYVLQPAVDTLPPVAAKKKQDQVTIATADFKALDSPARELWRRILGTLVRCFEHDQDGFWQAPAHFSAVSSALLAQLERVFVSAGAASSAPEPPRSSQGQLQPQGQQQQQQQQEQERDLALLISAVVELAAAADSNEHHKDLNTGLLRLLRSGRASVRLAAVRCQNALTARLGEEWLTALPEMLPYISELQDDDDEAVERENRRWIVGIEETLGESLDSMLQ